MDSKLEQAERAVDALFGDKSVPPSQTRNDLESLREKIDILVESLPKGD